MKQQTFIYFLTTVTALFLPGGGDNLLENPSFETGDLTGWTDVGGFVVGAPGAGAQSGSFAVEITLGGGTGELVQTFPASPGDEFNMSGWMLTETALPAGATFGLYKIVFRDSGGTDLLVTEISIGGQNPSFPGVESTPFLNDASPVGTWVFSEAQGVAPAGTVEVLFLVLNVDFPGTLPKWYDNVQASLVGDGTNLLVNPDFETGDTSGWSDNAGGGGGSVGAPGVGAQDGSFAALLAMDSATTTLEQRFPASPGDEYNLSGYMLTEGSIPPGDTFGLFKIVFKDAMGMDLEPESVSAGQATPNPDFPGIDSLPFLNNASPLNEWIFSEAQGVTPEGTVEVLFLILNVDFAPPGGIAEEMWFDNVSATLIGGKKCGFEIGDINEDGFVNLEDVDPFVQGLAQGIFLCQADINGDGFFNLEDVDPFVDLLAGG